MLLNYKLRKINQIGGTFYGAYKQLQDDLTMEDYSSEKTVRLLMYHGTIKDTNTNTNVFFCQEAACDINDDPFIELAPEEAGADDNPSIDPPNDQWVIALKLRLPIYTQLQEIEKTFRSYFWDSGGVKTGIERMGVRMNNENTLNELNNYIIEFKHDRYNMMDTDASWPSKLSQLLHLQEQCNSLKDSLERLEIQIDDFENLSFDFSNENSILKSVFKNSEGENDPRLSKHVEVPVTVRLSSLKNDLKNRIERSKPTRYMRDAEAEGDIITTKNRSLDLQSMQFLYNYKLNDRIGKQNINGKEYNIYKATIKCDDPLLGTSIGTQTE